MPDSVNKVLTKRAVLLAVLGTTSLAFGSAADREAPAAVLPGLNADPHIAVFNDTFYLYPNPILKGEGMVRGAGHHSIVRIPQTDQWVIAYHRFRIPDGDGYHRETCLAPLRHDEHGRILPIDVFEAVPPLTGKEKSVPSQAR
jgi:hypothetical protein